MKFASARDADADATITICIPIHSLFTPNSGAQCHCRCHASQISKPSLPPPSPSHENNRERKMEAAISAFCKTLSGVCNSVQSTSASLSDNVSRPPVPLGIRTPLSTLSRSADLLFSLAVQPSMMLVTDRASGTAESVPTAAICLHGWPHSECHWQSGLLAFVSSPIYFSHFCFG